jgi:hypothetical protein
MSSETIKQPATATETGRVDVGRKMDKQALGLIRRIPSTRRKALVSRLFEELLAAPV